MPKNVKIGRPTDNPKRHEVKIRFDDKTFDILNNYCQENSVTRAQGVRDAVNLLKTK